ncbi:Lrp/AsnC family transcriptional regulator for asnA, asnC and gidA [Bosea sp. AK1]|nr:Lrp/AsnC family transcriptional regulator for asnA, asnC and gidA [Bosea sp. AK1]
MGNALNGIKLDGLDKAIISALSKNGRQPYREIGRDLGISEATVRQRVSRLTDSGLIHIAAVGNFIALGFDVVAHILLKVPPAHVDEYARRLAEFPSVRFVTITFGGADIILQTLHTTTHSLHDFVRNEMPRQLPHIMSVEIFPQVETLKSSWSWEVWFGLEQEAGFQPTGALDDPE